METTDYIDVLYEAGEEVALDPATLSVGDFATLRRASRRWLEKCWEHHFWPLLQRVEQRWFRADWASGTTYAAGDEVFYPATQTYYQALRASTGEEPADADDITNTAYWAECETSYTTDEFDATLTYAVGDQVAYNGGAYACHTATTAGIVPTNTSYWGVLTEFERNISYTATGQTEIGLVEAVTSANPRIHTTGVELNWLLSGDGIVVKNAVASCWVSFRIRCPKLIGDEFDATETYAIGQQVFYTGGTERGNFYDCIAATSAGETPLSNPAKWEIVEIPRIFHKPLVAGMASAWVRGPGGGTLEEANAYEQYANSQLDDQKSLVVGHQSQQVRTVVMTR